MQDDADPLGCNQAKMMEFDEAVVAWKTWLILDCIGHRIKSNYQKAQEAARAEN